MAWSLMAPSHYLDHVDLLSVRSTKSPEDNIMRFINHQLLKIILKIANLKFPSNLSGANELDK